MRKVIELDSVDAYNRLYGLTTRHPFVSVVNLKGVRLAEPSFQLRYGIYALYLKQGVNCTLKYGRRKYDYQAGTVVSFSPGRAIDVEMAEGELTHDVTGLLFHPDLIYGTPLGKKIAAFNFFGFSQMEALHLSESEREIFLACLSGIDQELNHPVDAHSAAVISANIQLLLEYLDRFYDRQFITRHRVNSEIVAQFERLLKDYYGSSDKKEAIPAVSGFAEQLCLTPKYLSELLKKETGMTAKAIIMRHMVDVAKHRLAVSGDDVSEIAYGLGFQHPAHFSRMFRRMTGQSPSQFRDGLPPQ
ncbi:MAG: helix-turn-helix domain-containing protein [Muribaculaceae bacterium]|nr:helix-turn-helix domain-containing protein [Muribaculaceae bacterium]MDE6527027.1 helix-turn-helix domain-containing protein [Muribaculaceae bacterium]